MYKVWLIDGTCASYEEHIWADSVAEAESCADALLAAAQAEPKNVQPIERGPLGQDPGAPTKMCRPGYDASYFEHFSQGQLDACTKYWCLTCTWSVCP
jgi:hypothetical protein